MIKSSSAAQAHYNWGEFGGLMQDCSVSSALAMEILQYCTELSSLSNNTHYNNRHSVTRSHGMGCLL